MKIDERQLFEEFQNRMELYKTLLGRIGYYLSRRLHKEKGLLKLHHLSHRIKTFDSFLGKVKRKNPKLPFEEIHDIVAYRIVCLFLTDIENIQKIVQEEFNVFEIDDKIKHTNTNQFGYMDLKLKARLKSGQVPDELEHKQQLIEIPFEIQIRTIAQDAWASISHHLNYKKEEPLPYDMERDLNALSALFYVADTHFSLFPQEQIL